MKKTRELSNKELLEQLKNCGYDNYYRDIYKETVGEIRKRLNRKSVTKKAKWEIYMISYFDGEGCRCSLCGNEGTPDDNFCSNCGADMR